MRTISKKNKNRLSDSCVRHYGFTSLDFGGNFKEFTIGFLGRACNCRIFLFTLKERIYTI